MTSRSSHWTSSLASANLRPGRLFAIKALDRKAMAAVRSGGHRLGLISDEVYRCGTLEELVTSTPHLQINSVDQ